MDKVRFAVIGCGNIALRSSIPAIIKADSAELVVCIDILEKQGLIIKEKFNLPFETSLEAAEKKYDFDAVYIASPNGTHKDLIIEAAGFGKHILCEKSLAVNLNEVEEVVDLCRDKELALFEGFMYQFHTQHKFVKNLIDGDEIGDPILFQAKFGFPPLDKNDFRYKKSMGGGATLDAGAYTIHAARHFFNREPVNIYSSICNDGKEVEIRGSALLDFGHGKTAQLAYGFNNMYQNNYTVWGTKGWLSLDRAFSLPADFQSKIVLKKQGLEKEYIMDPCDHFVEEIEYFANNLTNKPVLEEWRVEALNQSRVLNSINRSTPSI